MKVNFFFLLLVFFVLLAGCKSANISFEKNKINQSDHIFLNQSLAINSRIDDTTFVKLIDYSSDFVFDMKYATEDNFLKNKVYDCEECYLRLKTVKSLIKANEDFKKKGFKIKIYDCYRPLAIQKKMWAILPNPIYVANPAKGSIHNRGGAVDITLIDKNGNELNMGTPFDFFGPEASHNYNNHSDEIKKNRKILKLIMKKNRFSSFESEWWHYNLKGSNSFNLADFKWICN